MREGWKAIWRFTGSDECLTLERFPTEFYEAGTSLKTHEKLSRKPWEFESLYLETELQWLNFDSMSSIW